MERIERREDIRNSESFHFKKWSFFGFCIIQVVLIILTAIAVDTLMDSYIDKIYREYNNEFRQIVKEMTVIMVWVVPIISICFQMLGLLGAYKHNLCLTVTYAVILTSETIVSVLVSIVIYYFWFDAILNIIGCLLCYSFANDLRKSRSIPQIITTNRVLSKEGVRVPTVLYMTPEQYEQNMAHLQNMSTNNYQMPYEINHTFDASNTSKVSPNWSKSGRNTNSSND